MSPAPHPAPAPTAPPAALHPEAALWRDRWLTQAKILEAVNEFADELAGTVAERARELGRLEERHARTAKALERALAAVARATTELAAIRPGDHAEVVRIREDLANAHALGLDVLLDALFPDGTTTPPPVLTPSTPSNVVRLGRRGGRHVR